MTQEATYLIEEITDINDLIRCPEMRAEMIGDCVRALRVLGVDWEEGEAA